ncbi:MAG: hypothetical protein ACLQLH_12780 [Terracidiphilus sp.]
MCEVALLCVAGALGGGDGLFVAPALAMPHNHRSKARIVAAETFPLTLKKLDFVIASSFLCQIRARLRMREFSI